MPAPKETIQRTSLTTDLESRYKQTADLANVGGGNAKDAGTSKAATNMVDVANEFSDQFKVKNPAGFTTAADQYSTDVLKVNTKPYAPNGRIAI